MHLASCRVVDTEITSLDGRGWLRLLSSARRDVGSSDEVCQEREGKEQLFSPKSNMASHLIARHPT